MDDSPPTAYACPMTDVWPIYQRLAAEFDEDRSRVLFERGWLDRLADGLAPGARVLDLGCGMGEPIARYLIGRGFSVTGIDAAPAMIALCAKRFPEHEWPGLEWIVADMRGLDLGRSFDAVLAWDSSFHLTEDEQRALIPVFARHAAPGARLMFTAGPAAGVAMGEYHGEPLYHASLDPEEYRALLEAEGFSILEFRPQDPDCGGHTVWLAEKTAA